MAGSGGTFGGVRWSGWPYWGVVGCGLLGVVLEIVDEKSRLDALEQQFERRRVRGGDWMVLAVFLGLLALVTSVAGVGFALRAID